MPSLFSFLWGFPAFSFDVTASRDVREHPADRDGGPDGIAADERRVPRRIRSRSSAEILRDNRRECRAPDAHVKRQREQQRRARNAAARDT